ncbi:MAG: aminopeptidase P family protein [Candidatus Dormibacteraeota bacterium]|nr:aminopeptidase P family protein [Candidatus Dormibacteraeota bacterium]
MTEETLLLAARDGDPAFRYASGFDVEAGLYVRFAEGDDLLCVSALEHGRARAEGRAARVVDRATVGWAEDRDESANWAQVARRLLAERGRERVRVAGDLPAALYVALVEEGVAVEVDPALFVAERRAKTPFEIDRIQEAQDAAQAALRAVVGRLRESRPGEDGTLWEGGTPLTSERLLARCQEVLLERGCANLEAIIAGSPECAMPHYRGTGPIRAGAPVIIDIFPRHLPSGYHGDLTRTVVVGSVEARVATMHEACVAAMEDAMATLHAGADGRDVHLAACRTLVARGFGTLVPGLEGPAGVPRMIHSTGHGVGLQVHEAPALRDAHYPLAAGDVVSVEPGVYLDGLGGVRVEDLVVVTADGYRNLTRLPASLDPADY